ncbi:hypothetical protein [Oligosphaera ethanolica]|uniref:Uncharacterized protein n=1 Tax=Oligosphaera ethanolica TaxID=760260 RepID=A0AAE3VE69_9BACT|nr:hypothetical protein [Oligosphaera ethanolica]MDQ0288675.1 hypothetical protein [Oligosphaera ethanolica]
MQEPHGPPPPSHPTLISADLYGIGFIGVYTPALRWDHLQDTHGQSPPIWETNQAASFIGVIDICCPGGRFEHPAAYRHPGGI